MGYLLNTIKVEKKIRYIGDTFSYQGTVEHNIFPSFPTTVVNFTYRVGHRHIEVDTRLSFSDWKFRLRVQELGESIIPEGECCLTPDLEYSQGPSIEETLLHQLGLSPYVKDVKTSRIDDSFIVSFLYKDEIQYNHYHTYRREGKHFRRDACLSCGHCHKKKEREYFKKLWERCEQAIVDKKRSERAEEICSLEGGLDGGC